MKSLLLLFFFSSPLFTSVVCGGFGLTHLCSACARVDHKKIHRRIQIKTSRVENLWGPLDRLSSKKQEHSEPISGDNPQAVQQRLILLPEGVEERVRNMEEHLQIPVGNQGTQSTLLLLGSLSLSFSFYLCLFLSISICHASGVVTYPYCGGAAAAGGVTGVPRDVYERLKACEDRILELEQLTATCPQLLSFLRLRKRLHANASSSKEPPPTDEQVFDDMLVSLQARF